MHLERDPLQRLDCAVALAKDSRGPLLRRRSRFHTVHDRITRSAAYAFDQWDADRPAPHCSTLINKGAGCRLSTRVASFPTSRLIEYARGYYDEGNSNLLKTHISYIREKLSLAPSGKCGIKAVLVVGYSLSRG